MIRHSGATEPSPRVHDLTADHRRQSTNRRFFEAALRYLGGEDSARIVIGLLGQRDLPGVALRRAQAITRWDLRPSLWSHAFLLVDPSPDEPLAALAYEVSLHPRTGVFPEPARNAVTATPLRLYDDARVDANVALLGVPLDDAQAAAVAARAVDDPNLDRLRYDFWQSLGVWQTYLWSAGAAPNPLREGFPVSSSALIEYCFEAVQLDLAPATSERNSAPEHLWNAARWWDRAYTDLEQPISGCYVVRDPNCGLLDPTELAAVEAKRVGRAVRPPRPS